MNFPETKAESKVFCNKRQSRNMRTVQGMFNEACETAAIVFHLAPPPRPMIYDPDVFLIRVKWFEIIVLFRSKAAAATTTATTNLSS